MMTKVEFALALEKYHEKRQREKWEWFGIGCVLILLVFSPQARALILSGEFEVARGVLCVFAGLCFGQFLTMKKGRKEDELLISAMDLLKAKSNQIR